MMRCPVSRVGRHPGRPGVKVRERTGDGGEEEGGGPPGGRDGYAITATESCFTFAGRPWPACRGSTNKEGRGQAGQGRVASGHSRGRLKTRISRRLVGPASGRRE